VLPPGSTEPGPFVVEFVLFWGGDFLRSHRLFFVVAWAPIGVDEPIADDAENGRTGQLDSGALEPA